MVDVKGRCDRARPSKRSRRAMAWKAAGIGRLVGVTGWAASRRAVFVRRVGFMTSAREMVRN